MNGSKEVMAAAIKLAVTGSIEEEKALIKQLKSEGVLAAAVNYGGEYISSIGKIIERSIIAAHREGVIGVAHNEEGAVAGAAHEAIAQIDNKALGLNIGGKIGIARLDEHICVAMYFGVGLVHLNEIAIGIGHRVI
ncbi:MAG: HutP family protein [Clostridia bacterium]|nr:HutP family protein [Clostridia bacterium]